MQLVKQEDMQRERKRERERERERESWVRRSVELDPALAL